MSNVRCKARARSRVVAKHGAFAITGRNCRRRLASVRGDGGEGEEEAAYDARLLATTRLWPRCSWNLDDRP